MVPGGSRAGIGGLMNPNTDRSAATPSPPIPDFPTCGNCGADAATFCSWDPADGWCCSKCGSCDSDEVGRLRGSPTLRQREAFQLRKTYDTFKFTDREIEDELHNDPPRNRSDAYLSALRAEKASRTRKP